MTAGWGGIRHAPRIKGWWTGTFTPAVLLKSFGNPGIGPDKGA